MNVRELLRYEIWSKRTTRKILLDLGIAIGLASFSFWCWHEVEIHWLTSGERNAARAALTQIDAFERSGPLSFAEYQDRTNEVEASLRTAYAAARTSRDRIVQMKLRLYSSCVLVEQSEALRQNLILQGRIPPQRPKDENDRKIESLMLQMKQSYRQELHKELD